MPAAVNNNFQEYDPRHRLTGAVVLILLAIILLPMLLSKSPEKMAADAEPVVMEVTKEGKKVFVSRITTVSPDEQAVSSKSEASSSSKTKESLNEDTNDEDSSALFKPMSHTAAAKSAAVKSKSSAASSKPAVKSTTSKSTTSKPAASKSVATTKSSTAKASSSWILQVGVFSQSANARKKVSELKKKGFNAKSVKIKNSKGVVTRVWIGPFTDRASAEKMQDRLQHKTRQRGMVVKK